MVIQIAAAPAVYFFCFQMFVLLLLNENTFCFLFYCGIYIYIYIKEKNYNIAIMFFLHRFAGSQFMASIEIDADFTDADYDLQSQRMTDLDEEVCSLLF